MGSSGMVRHIAATIALLSPANGPATIPEGDGLRRQGMMSLVPPENCQQTRLRARQKKGRPFQAGRRNGLGGDCSAWMDILGE